MSIWDDFKVAVPEGTLDGVSVERFTLDQEASGWTYLREGGRGIPAGTYTRLVVDNQTWMSDTPAEILDHWPAIDQIRKPTTKRVLINGLGLGMIVKHALSQPHVEHVDVVEIDKRVIELAGPTYTSDDRVHVHRADAFDQSVEWPRHSHWDVVWHDIWRDLDVDNLPHMARLGRSYGGRSTWQGAWGKEILRQQRKRDRQIDERLKEFMR